MNKSCKIVAIEHLSLDGVYQAPARADEDTRDGFLHGGWAIPRSDVKMQQAMGKSMANGWSLLMGRTTYEDLFEAWPTRQPDSPMTRALTSTQKFVVTNNPGYPAAWQNTTILPGDAAETVARLKQEHDKALIIFGSGILVRTLIRQKLLDEMLLMIHPVVLGEGRKLFTPKILRSELKLTETSTTDAGVIIASYQLLYT